MSESDIEKSIFIIGTGRSGTTILYDILATHPELAWFSMLSNNHPGSRGWIRFHKLLETDTLGDYLKSRIITPTRFSRPITYYLRPNEGADIYTTYCGFDDNRRMTEEDYDAEMERKLKGLIEMHLEVTGKRRFMNKRTANTQRIRLIHRMFPNAYYIHMIRDGRAAIASYLNVDWWKDMTAWSMGVKVSDWNKAGKDPVELATKHWRANLEEILSNKSILARYMEVKYEDFVKDTWAETKRMTDFCGLSFPENFKRILPKSLPNMNFKWRKQITQEQSKIIDEYGGDLLKQLGYAES